MAFVDDITIHAEAGKGGDGVIRWLHTKEKARGGPSGGDGGRGGDVVFVGVRDLAALAHFRYEKRFHAENGEAGKNELKHGADGASLFIKVPVGTIARIIETGQEFEVTKDGEEITVFKGGSGGYGNARFKSSTNQNPFHQTAGKKGQGGDIHLTLKIIADVGLVGLPNAGKSSLLNALTRAKSKVGSYPFTTLEPHLGDFYGYIIADIPGLIEGASTGRGLGIKFLKHLERTGFLLHLVSASQEDVVGAYSEVRKEIDSFGHGLSGKKEFVVLSKTDLVTPDEIKTKASELANKAGTEVILLTVEDEDNVKKFSQILSDILAHQT